MSTDDSRREIAAARREAEQQAAHATEQEPLIRAEAQAVRWFLAENNLAARFRTAFTWGK